jgi:hypothetical protein
MKSRYYILSLLLPFFSISLPGQMKESGAAIVLNASGLVEAVSPDGKKVPGLVKRGSVLTEGFTISTGAFAESVLLFSNGTVATLNEKTAVRISIFSQEPFEAGNINFEGMQGEPSQSHLSLSLLNGSLVVKTKKLNDLSVFNIKTVEGVIRVKGTEFQLGASQDQGIQLDVSESTVSFLPKGSSKPVQVSGGSGLDVGKGGTNQRPISPITAQKISTKNRFASVIASKVPLSTIKQASAKAQTVAGRSSSESDDQDDEAYEDEYEEEQEGEDSVAEKALALTQTSSRAAASSGASDYADSINELLQSAEPQAGHFRFEEGTGAVKSLSILFYENDPDKADAENPEEALLQSLTYDSTDFSSLTAAKINSDFSSLYGYQLGDIDAIGVYVFLEDYFSTTPKVQTSDLYDGLNKALALAKKVLSVDATYTSSTSLSAAVMSGSDLYTDFLSPSGYGEQAVRIIGHYASANSRDSILQISEDVFAIFNETSSPTSIAFGSTQSDDTIALNVDLLSDENRQQTQEVTLLGVDTSSTQETKEVTDLPSTYSEDRKDLNREIYKTELSNLSVIPGRDIMLGTSGSTTEFDVSTLLDASSESASDRKSLAITATDDLHLKGDITFKNSNNENPGHDVLLLGAADHIEGLQYNSSDQRQKVTNEGTHLVMGSYSHLTARNVDIKTSGKLAIGSLEDLVLDTVKFDAGRASKNDNITLYSDQTLHLRDPSFIGNAQEIYMQGITVNFENVIFDSSKAYLIRSQSGKHNFGSSNPGDVNFIGNNYWGSISADNKIDPDFFYEVSTKGDSVMDGYNSHQTVTLDTGETAGIRIRQIQ